MCYWLIAETGKLVSKILVKNIIRDDYLKLDIEFRVDDFSNKFTDQLDDGNFQVNSDVDGKFDFILPDKDLIKNLGVKYDSNVTPTDEE